MISQLNESLFLMRCLFVFWMILSCLGREILHSFWSGNKNSRRFTVELDWGKIPLRGFGAGIIYLATCSSQATRCTVVDFCPSKKVGRISDAFASLDGFFLDAGRWVWMRYLFNHLVFVETDHSAGGFC